MSASFDPRESDPSDRVERKVRKQHVVKEANYMTEMTDASYTRDIKEANYMTEMKDAQYTAEMKMQTTRRM